MATGAANAVAQEGGSGAVAVQTAEAREVTLYQRIHYGCRIKPAERYPHRSPITGVIEEMLVRPGERVRAGRPLFSVRRDLSGRTYRSVTVEAARAGVISTESLDAGDPVQEGDAVVEVLDTASYSGTIMVSDKDIPFLSPGDEVRLAENGARQEKGGPAVTGRIALIHPEPEYETGLFPVELRFPAAEGLFVGKFVRVELRIRPYTGIAVAAEHLERKYGRDHLFVVEDGVANLRQVSLGARYDGRVVVQKGLQRGERYVVSASERLSDGTPVTLRD